MDRRASWTDLRERPLVFPALLFAFGAWLGGQHPPASYLFLILGLAASFGTLAWAPRPGAYLTSLLAFLSVGAFLSTLEGRTQVPAALATGEKARLGGIVEQKTCAPDGCRIELWVEHLWGPNPAPASFRVRLVARGALPAVAVGSTVLLTAQLHPPDAPANPGQPDFGDQALARGVVRVGGFDPATLVPLSQPSPARAWLEALRERLAAAAKAKIADPKAASLYLTLAAGLRAELGDDTEEEFARSGLAHVLSVSGLHVALLGLALVFALRFGLRRVHVLSRRIDVRRLAAPLAVPLVWGYVLFTGNQPPAVRSAVMVSVLFAGMALWRRADALNSLAIAGLGLLGASPSSVRDLSLRLSFVAVGSLILVSPSIRAALPIRKPNPQAPPWSRRVQRLRETLLQTFCASLAATLASAPLLAASFHRLSFAGLVSNVVCLPLCGALTLLAAGGAALFAIAPGACGPVLWAGGLAAKLLLVLVRLFAALPGASVFVPSFGPALCAIFWAGLLLFALGSARLRWLGLTVPLVLGGLFIRPLWASRGELQVTFLSVGHGDAIVLLCDGHAALIDGGGVPGGADPGERIVLPYLYELGVSHLDLAVLSHPHPDHALGLATVLSKVPVDTVWLPAGEPWGELQSAVVRAAGRAHVERVERGHLPFRLGAAQLEVLGPPRDRILLEGVNDRSLVLAVRHRDVSVLLPGDLEAAGEEALLAAGLPPMTVVKAPHHGSGTSSTEGFVNALSPKVAIFSVGLHSRFHFPADEVVERYRRVGAQTFRTDLDGAVTVRSDGQRVRVTTFRPDHEPTVPPAIALGASGANP